MMNKALRTSTVVHASEVDTDEGFTDAVNQMVLRLERRAGRRIPWVSIGPIPIRRSMEERCASHTYQVQVISGDLG